jgi:3-hydroxybutyryl-CoA dehydrogenase
MAIETITVIGAGAIGRGVAYAALAGGYRTILEDVLPEKLVAAQSDIRVWFDEAISHSEFSAEQKDQALARLSTASSVDLACREAELVIETLPEDLEMKVDVFCILEKFARPGAILASNTSALSITEIAAVTTRAACCVGLHFVNPVAGMKRLEVVRALETSDETIAACCEVGRRMGKEVVVVLDRPDSSLAPSPRQPVRGRKV